jgi:uncharacterized membrane protein YccC
MISLPTAGQSLEKAGMRMLGTLVASIAALTLIALYPQDRWLFMTCVSIYVATCAYMMYGSKHQYFWFVAAFVALIICVNAGPNAEDAFNIVVTRTLETALGIVVYTMVSVFLWPQSSAAELETTAKQLLDVQGKLFEAYRNASNSQDLKAEATTLRVQGTQLHTHLTQLLNAAASESYEVREHRRDWLRLNQVSRSLLQTLESWRESFPEISHLELTRFIPNLEAVYRDIEKNFEEISDAWSGTDSGYEPPQITLEIDHSEIRRLSHLERAALELMKANLESMASHCKDLLGCVQALKGFSSPIQKTEPPETTPRISPVDPDRLIAVCRVIATLWIAFLIWIYLDPPGHDAFVQLTATIALALVMIPQARPTMLLLPICIGSAFAGVIYMLVMPKLSGYLELGAVLFAAIFSISFLFSEPRQGLSRLMGFVTLLTLTSIQNQQTYSFPQFANSTAMLILMVVLLTALSYIPFSPRPEKVFLRLMDRFKRCAAYLLSQPEETARDQGRFGRKWRSDFSRRNLDNIPARLGQLSHVIDFTIFSPSSQDQIKALLASVETLKFRIHAVDEAHRQARSEPLLATLRDDIAAWRVSLAKQLEELGNITGSGAQQDPSRRLQVGLAKVEARMEETLSSPNGEQISDESFSNVYRILGSYRGLAEAIAEFVRISNSMDWSRWREARF